jgi:hypothetical protein
MSMGAALFLMKTLPKRRSLYQYGYDKAKTGDLWAKAPPSDDLLQNDGRSRKSATRQ